MYITPNTSVKILKGVDLDRGYNHTRRFTSKEEQYKFFTNTLGGDSDSGTTIKYQTGTAPLGTPFTYQRASKKSIRVGIVADNLYDCNYLMFQNSSYGNKWFYAFIDSIEYINDNATEIYFTIDVMQTWMFDYVVENCFVEREHTAHDEVGSNTVSENFDFQEKLVIDILYAPFSFEFLGGIVLTRRLSGIFHKTIVNGNVVYTQFCDPKYIENQGFVTSAEDNRAQTGLPDSLYIYTGFSIKRTDNDYDSNFYMQQNSLYPTRAYSLTEFISQLKDGNLYTYDYEENDYVQITYEDILTIYQYPKEFSKISDNTAAITEGFGAGFSKKISSYTDMTQPTKFLSKKPNGTAYLFTNVKNKKLLTAPYLNVVYSDFNGNKTEYAFENFLGSNDLQHYRDSNGIVIPTIVIYGNRVGGCTFNIIPFYYDSLSSKPLLENNETTYQLNALFSGNALSSYLQQNKDSMNFGVLASIITGVIGVVGGGVGVATGAAAGSVASALGSAGAIVGAAGGTIKSIGNSVAKINDLRRTPPPSQFSQKTPYFLLNNSIDGIGGTYGNPKTMLGGLFYSVGINAECAKIVDDYFTMFGYAVNELKTPNIYAHWYDNLGVYIRPYWNYVKTNGAIIHPSSTGGLPADVEKQISDILDNGITFWSLKPKSAQDGTAVPIGDYSYNNAASNLAP